MKAGCGTASGPPSIGPVGAMGGRLITTVLRQQVCIDKEFVLITICGAQVTGTVIQGL